MADNFTAIDGSDGTTQKLFKAKEIASALYPGKILYDEAGVEVVGRAVAAPAPYTLLGRLAALAPDFDETTANFAPMTIGSNALLAAASGEKHRLYKLHITVSAACTLVIKSGSNSKLSVILVSAGTWILDFDGTPWVTGGNNEALTIDSSAAVTAVGTIFTTTGA